MDNRKFLVTLSQPWVEEKYVVDEDKILSLVDRLMMEHPFKSERDTITIQFTEIKTYG